MKPNQKNFIIALSFANYLRDKTGMPKVMMEHQQMYNNAKVSYIGLFSIKKNIFDDRYMLFCKFGLIIDGVFHGIYQMNQLINLFATWCKEGHNLLDIHIHHLLYVNLKLADEMLAAFFDVPIKVYLHDYYNACSNHNLMKNKTVFCGGRGLRPEYCSDCQSFQKSIYTEQIIHRMYHKYFDRITFISPSEITRSIFLNFHPEYAKKVVVYPHEVFNAVYRGNLQPVLPGEKIRVAYLGMPVFHKGWKTWNRLISSVDPDLFEFIVFNSSENHYDGMRKVKVAFSPEHINAMTDALRDEKVHVAILWSMCPETYSYTCFEAFSSNAFLITRTDSGNIADTVQHYKCGVVLKTEDELVQMFQDAEKLRCLINHYREHTQGGPDKMLKNKQIVTLTLQNQSNSKQTVYRRKRKPINHPLLFLLNTLYKRGKI